MKTLDSFVKEYHECLNKQSFIQKDLDYSALEKYKPTLKQLSLLGNTGITVFDLFQKENVFASYNFNALFGYNQDDLQKNASEFFNSRIHAEDFPKLIQNYIAFTNFLYTLPKEERVNYKLLNQFRVLNSGQKYVEVFEQYQLLESDKNGNIWLGSAVIDIAPDQNIDRNIHSQIFNFKTGNYLPLDGTGKESFTSQDIPSSLSANLHKVNSQRKKMLEKINADNLEDAIKRVAKLGLVG